MSLPIEGSLNYLAVLILMIIAVVLSVVIIGLNKLTGRKPSEITRKKYDTYECGVGYEGSAHQQFSVRYYLIGIIFLLFDVEVVFMYPWTLAYQTYLKSGPVILLEMGLFFALLLGGYFYLRLRGALNWD
ncbi:NADH-quinone oxidoreductase subunit A [Peredibacter starrii]|uniref:NADH-quinone oxidoreductase subunit n=1 Tax=Peredibacter starrii TaxID=28202 RepID=A0AAX4HSG7_9BACT|nr:NADH-quinone oxidoreductase subunit A [Peredibacter starrii]WPU66162.1 NADH-quinone oxidoreductase subunit A [Peredibacter starrii]